MVSDDERSNTYRERVEALNAFAEQKELPEVCEAPLTGLVCLFWGVGRDTDVFVDTVLWASKVTNWHCLKANA
eukprot:881846-Pelagomonas_calceolata.AAC.7